MPGRHVVMVLLHDFLVPHKDPRVYKEARTLVQAGERVTILCGSRHVERGAQEEDVEGIRVVRLAMGIPPPHTSLARRVPAFGAFCLRAARHVRRLRPDVVHCHDLETLAIGAAAVSFTRTPLVFDAHEDYPSLWISMHPRQRAVGRVLRAWERLLLRRAQLILAAEILYRDTIRASYGRDCVVIENLPDLGMFRPDAPPAPVRERLGIPEDAFLVVQVGAISEPRGVLESVAAVGLAGEGVHLLLVGKTDADFQRRIRDAAEAAGCARRVHLLPEGVPFEDVPALLRACDLSLALLYPLPTYVTSVPTKLYESLAAGVPVLGAALPHVEAILEGNGAGLCADAKDPAAIAKAIERVRHDPRLREALVARGIALTRERWSWDASGRRLVEAYRALPGGGAS